jgi:hypothetical protein
VSLDLGYGCPFRQESTHLKAVERGVAILMPSIGTEWGTAMRLGATWDEFWKTLRSGNLFVHAHQSARE